MTYRLLLSGVAVALCAGCVFSSDKCKSARDCNGAQRCVSGQCQDPTAGTGLIGDSCTASADCQSGLTCNTAFSNGACTQDCSSASCGGSAACTATTAGQLCAPGCSADTDCRSGYVCCAAQGHACLPTSLCAPPAGQVTCNAPALVSAGLIQGHASAPASCQKPVNTSALPSSQIQALGQHRTGDSVTFNVPQGTGSFTIVQQALNATSSIVAGGSVVDNSVVAHLITRPDGTVIYDDFKQQPADPSDAGEFYGGGSPSTGAMTVPDTADGLNQLSASGSLQPGTWKFQVTDYAWECANASGCTDGGVNGNTYDVTVLTKAGIATPPGALDLAFYIVGSGTTITSASAPANPSVQRMIKTMSGVLANAGICLGTVSFYDVPAWAQQKYGTSINADDTGPCSALDQMITLSQPGNVLNLFLVQSITSVNSGGGSVVGIDGTIPGPATIGGTIHSGAAVSMADLTSGACTGSTDLINCGADRVAYIASHESGHYLGLFHTTELDGESYDPLSDTAQCSCEVCANSTQRAKCATPGKSPAPSPPGYVGAVDCVSGGCGGGENLMFWQLDASVSRGTLSPQQGQVARLSPAVH